MEAQFPLAGRVAIVTGAASGIGRAIAVRLATSGARVVVADLDEVGGQLTARAIETTSGEASFLRTDVTSHAALAALVAHAVKTFGRLDIMCNNAGIASGGPFLEWTPEQYERVIAVNQHGVFYGIQAAGRAMRDGGAGGVIINTGSVYGALASRYCAPYLASKASVEILTKAAALELAPYAIRVVNVAPGVVETAMSEDYRRLGVLDSMAKKHMRGALLQADAIARVVLFVATDAAAVINGTTVFADDGYSSFK
jgi:glucose 1-dehydrogenase